MGEEPPIDVLKMALCTGTDEADWVNVRLFRLSLIGQFPRVGDAQVCELDDSTALF
jgi:hypothetical protein